MISSGGRPKSTLGKGKQEQYPDGIVVRDDIELTYNAASISRSERGESGDGVIGFENDAEVGGETMSRSTHEHDFG